jgi:hypothetical protein
MGQNHYFFTSLLPPSFSPKTPVVRAGRSLRVDGSRGGEGVHRGQGQQRLLLAGRVRVWAAGLARVRSPLVVRVGDMWKRRSVFFVLSIYSSVIKILTFGYHCVVVFYFTLVVGT